MGGEEKEVDETSMGSPQRRAHIHQRTLHTHKKKKSTTHHHHLFSTTCKDKNNTNQQYQELHQHQTTSPYL